MGDALSTALYTLPPFLFALWLAVSRRRDQATLIDVFPFAYAALAVASLLLTEADASSGVRGAVTTVGFAVAAYYFCAFGPLSSSLPRRLCRMLLLAAVVLATMALVEAVAGWNLWNNADWRGGDPPRVVATLDNPAALGTYLAIAVAVAVVILFWDGPSDLRRLSLVVVVLALPAMVFTYTRGPFLALFVVVAPLLLLRQRIRWKSALVLAAALLVGFVGWSRLASSPIYEERVANAATVQTRVVIQNWSLELAAEKPILGWGYQSFDRVKNAQAFRATALERTLGTNSTSHDTFLTILVELGAVGLFLFVVPWLVIGVRLVRFAQRATEEQWFALACLAIIATFAISATTFDMRFFSFMSALPWIAAGCGRRLLARDA